MVSKREKHKKHPQFLRPNYGRKSRSRIGIAWRRPRGIDNKKRTKLQKMGASPNIGYGKPASVRHTHPSGKKEVRVENMMQLQAMIGAGAKASEYAVRIAAGVGKKKKKGMVEAAQQAGLVVLNPGLAVLNPGMPAPKPKI